MIIAKISTPKPVAQDVGNNPCHNVQNIESEEDTERSQRFLFRENDQVQEIVSCHQNHEYYYGQVELNPVFLVND